MRMLAYAGMAAILFCAAGLAAQDYKPIPRVLPPIGKKIKLEERRKLESGLAKLDERIKSFAEKDPSADLLADVETYEKAVRFALLNNEFYSEKDFPVAESEIATANKRLDELAANQPAWTTAHGQLVRGYHSIIDGSVQPYGLEIPEGLDLSKPTPLYVWLHGRGDSDTDLHFIHSREGRRGQIRPEGAIVMHAFGRQCLGFKSAGEIDIFEAINSVEHRYNIDPDRVVLMGFSMGGAGAWHVGAHYADRFVAVHAGAGFIDVARYRHLKPEQYPAWYEQKLWGVYDVPDYVRDLFNTTMVAYGGEIDPQRASSQIMAEEYKAEGQTLTRLVGPKMPHKYDPASLAEIMRLMNAAVEKGLDRYPRKVYVQTRTLEYPTMFWVTLTGLKEHWQDSRLDAELVDDSHIVIKTKNVQSFFLDWPWAKRPAGDGVVELKIDDSVVKMGADEFPIRENHSGIFRALPKQFTELTLTPTGWKSEKRDWPLDPPRKTPILMGPIDHAFVAPFLVVTPSGQCADPRVQKWVDFELNHFQNRWRATFRGDLRMKKDVDVTAEDIANYHLIAWGDAGSNKLIAQVIGKLPLKWSGAELAIAGKTYDAATHVPLMIFPNPLNPSHYIVLNSGPTFREGSDGTNSLQNPKLPDWAVIDITTPPDGFAAGKVDAAGFFDEGWGVSAVNH